MRLISGPIQIAIVHASDLNYNKDFVEMFGGFFQ